MPSSSAVRSAHAGAIGGGKKRCSVGKNCSAACIERRDSCLVEIPVSPAAAMSQFRDKTRDRNKQLQLFDVAGSLSEGKLKEHVAKENRAIKRDMMHLLHEGVGWHGADTDRVFKEKYNEIRDRAIQFNQKMVKEGLAEKSGLIKVPVSYEKYRDVLKRYEKAIEKLEEDLEKAAIKGDRDKYDKIERRAMAVERKLGSRLGQTRTIEKNKVWGKYAAEREERRQRESNMLYNEVKDRAGRQREVEHHGNSLTITGRANGHKVQVELADYGSAYNLKVNDEYRMNASLSKADRYAITKEALSMFNILTESMPENSIVKVTPYTGDGRSSDRLKMFRQYGFGGEEGAMTLYGRVEDGKMTPSSGREFSRYMSSGPLPLMRSDDDYSETKVKSIDRFLSLDEIKKLREKGDLKQVGQLAISMGTVTRDNDLRRYGASLLSRS